MFTHFERREFRSYAFIDWLECFNTNFCAARLDVASIIKVQPLSKLTTLMLHDPTIPNSSLASFPIKLISSVPRHLFPVDFPRSHA